MSLNPNAPKWGDDDDGKGESSVAYVTKELSKLDAEDGIMGRTPKKAADKAADKDKGKDKVTGGGGDGAPSDGAKGKADEKAPSGGAVLGDLDDDDEPLPEPSETGLDPQAITDKISVMQSDPNSPLFAATTFEEIGLRPEVLKGVYACKFVKPSKIQSVSLPMIVSDPRTDLVAQAQSGTGKTASFVLGMLATIDEQKAAPQALCLCPTRELARQVMSVVRQLAKYTQVQSQLVLKEEKVAKGSRMTSQVIVGTSGSVLSYIQKRVMPVDQIRMFVLDEADEMVRLQGQGDMTAKIKKLLPKTCQTLLFSATFPPEVDKLVSRIARTPNSIRVEREQLTVDGIKQLVVDCGTADKKFDHLSNLYAMLTIGQTVIFTRTRETGEDVTRRMTEAGYAVSLLHGKLEPAQRDEVIDRFRSGKSKVLITTNVLSRGIDIAGVTLVINYDIPVDGNGQPDPEAYLHRIGRSGRFGRKGVAVNFVHDENSRKALNAILKVYNKEIEELSMDDDEKLERYIKESMA